MSVIAGSMGTPSYLVSGRGHPDSLQSSSHGAGRVLGRHEARKRIGVGELKRQMQKVEHVSRALERLRDKAPSAYRDIREVLQAQQALTRQILRLTPILNFKYPDPRERD